MIKKQQSPKDQERNMACAFCAKHLTESNASKEHVIPNAIGGRKTINNFICVDTTVLTFLFKRFATA